MFVLNLVLFCVPYDTILYLCARLMSDYHIESIKYGRCFFLFYYLEL